MQTMSARLHYQDRTSDKVYELDIVQNANGLWECQFAYGRRGTSLNRGEKTKEGGEDYNKARTLYGKLLGEKTSKGYQILSETTGNGTPIPATASPSASTATFIEQRLRPMLPSPISQEDLATYILDAQWGMQQKYDGENRTLFIDKEGVKAGNRRGQEVTPNPVFCDHDLDTSLGRTILYGEDLGDIFVAFDALMINGMSLEDQPLKNRHTALSEMIDESDWLKIAPLAVGAAAKKMMIASIENDNLEGVVFKRLRSVYQNGRSTEHLKFKFKESSTFFVEAHDPGGKRSVQLSLPDPSTKEHVLLGNVTIPVNYEMPTVGALVEVSYMYRYDNGALEQPVYKGERTDLDYEPDISQIRRIKHRAAA